MMKASMSDIVIFDTHGISPRFPFGFGLSYTKFSFQNLSQSTETMIADYPIIVNFDVINTGERDGQEVAQLYIQPVNPPIDRPTKELKRFQKVLLAPAETRSLQFEINAEDLAYFDESLGQWVTAPGNYKILVGNSSRDLLLEGSFTYQSN